MSTVKLQKLGTLCKMQSGGTPSRKNDKFWDKGNVLWAKISDLEGSPDGYIYSTEECITDSGLASINNRVFPENTLFLAMYGSVGKVAISKVPMSTNQAILGINIIDNKVLDLKFLKHWFLSTKEELLNKAVGVALKNISLGLVKDLEIPLPPLDVQKAIAEKVDKADALRRKDQELLAQYDELAQAIFIDMFGDPVQNEKGWEKISLEEIGTLSSGSTPSREKDDYFSGIIPWVKTTEVKNEYILSTSECISDEALENSSCKLYPKDSIIIAMYGQGKTRGQVGFLKIDATTNQACCVVQLTTSEYNKVFLFELLKLLYLDLRELGRGGNQPNLNVGILKKYTIINPPTSLQNQFAEKIKNIEVQKALVKRQAEESENLFQALLQESFDLA